MEVNPTVLFQLHGVQWGGSAQPSLEQGFGLPHGSLLTLGLQDMARAVSRIGKDVV